MCHEGWHACATCKQQYEGAMRLGLAATTQARPERRPLCCAEPAGLCLHGAGRDTEEEEAGELFCVLLAAYQRLVVGLTMKYAYGRAESDMALRASTARLRLCSATPCRRCSGSLAPSTNVTARELAGALQRSRQLRRGRAVAARHAGDAATRAW